MRKVLCFTVVLFSILLMTGTMAMAECKDSSMGCVKIVNGSIYDQAYGVNLVGRIVVNNCWSSPSCKPCGGWEVAAKQCSSAYGSCSGDTCAACEMYLVGGNNVNSIKGPCRNAQGNTI